AGAFGGVLGALILAVVGDVFAEEQRGLATGVLMTAFSVATIVGVPAGLALAVWLWTAAPFAVLAGLSVLGWLLAAGGLPPLRHPLAGGSPLALPAWRALLQPPLLRAYALTTCIVLTTFLLVPFLATFLVTNVGFREADLSWMYLCGGLATLVTMPW